MVEHEKRLRGRSRRLKIFSRALSGRGKRKKSVTFEAEKKDYQVNDEQENDCDFEDKHPSIALIVIQQLVKVIEGLELVIYGFMPIP